MENEAKKTPQQPRNKSNTDTCRFPGPMNELPLSRTVRAYDRWWQVCDESELAAGVHKSLSILTNGLHVLS